MRPNFKHVVSVCVSGISYVVPITADFMNNKFSFSVVQPLIITLLDNTTTVIHEGMNSSFTYEATGYPIPTVTWHRVDGSSTDGVSMNDNILTEDGSDNVLIGGGNVSANLVITNASRENTGVYICSASNTIGTDSRSITIICKYIQYYNYVH